ncbi:hypothetical protein GCM10017673_38240 [Streptosporangium violaceochromogenes]|nr:hypothetical protein GCM10017673_38240 [Streptosporangium violaceochromogenes]
MGNYTATADAVASTTARKTILQVANPASNPASHRIAFYGIWVGGKGIASNAVPLHVMLAYQTTAGAGGVALAAGYGPAPLDPALPASAMTALKGPAAAWGTEPTLGAVPWVREMHPQSGQGEYIPLGDEIRLAPGGWVGLLVTAAAAVNVTAQLYWREGH